MLSTNFLLLRTAPLSRAERKSLMMIFSSTYLDMYDLALFVGYAVYLSAILLPPLKLYQALLLFSGVLFAVQITKILGLIAFHYFLSRFHRNILLAPLVIAICYFMLAVMPSYAECGAWAFVWFSFLRLVQGVAFGFEIGFTIHYSNTHISNDNKRFMYYFIIFSGEMGAFICILVNRLMIDNGMSVAKFDLFWRLQFLVGCIFILVNLRFRVKQKRLSSKITNFSRLSFFCTLRRSGHYILLRGLILSLSACLIIMVIFRIPNYLHLAVGLSYVKINLIIIYITMSAFCGSLSAKYIAQIVPPAQLMTFFYVLTILLNIIAIVSQANLYYYTFWLLGLAFIYGSFLRLNTMVLYRVSDFNTHNRLTGRYMGYVLAHYLFGSFAIFAVDISRYNTHNFRDYAPEATLLIAALSGLIALRIYTKHFHK